MRQRAFFSGLALGAGLAIVALLGADPLSGQSNYQPELTRTQFGLGYIANAPDAMIGGGAYVVFPVLGGIGIYVDGKFDSSHPTDDRGYDPSLTADEVEDKVPGAVFIEKEVTWKSFNLAVVRPVTPYLMVYGGAGWANKRYFHLFEDNIGRAFLVSAPDEEKNVANFMVGTILRMTRSLSSHFGFETQPFGVTVGFSVRIPSW